MILIYYEFASAYEFDGTGMSFYDKNIDDGLSPKSIVWVVSCKIKDDKLYMTVDKDNISNYEGKTIVLHQQPLEETEDEETKK